jgi:P-type Ca2+ transporter type 2C
VMFTALLVGLKVPLLAIQILWINLVTDGLPAIALGFEPAEVGVMRRKPRHKNESIFAGGVGRHIISIGILIAALTFMGYYWGYTSNGMDPFSDTHGLETKTRAEMVSIVGDIVELPDDWDELSAEQRKVVLDVEDAPTEAETVAHEAGEGLMGRAESRPRSIAFTILAFTQMFEVMAIHGGDTTSFFRTGFKGNWLLFWAVLSTFVLQLIVLYVPFLQDTFGTTALTVTELILATIAGALVLVAVEFEKWLNRNYFDKSTTGQLAGAVTA